MKNKTDGDTFSVPHGRRGSLLNNNNLFSFSLLFIIIIIILYCCCCYIVSNKNMPLDADITAA